MTSNILNFSLPEIQISSNLYTALKIIFLVGGFIVVAFNLIASASAYEFVYCTNQDTHTTMIYPEGTLCDDELEEEEEQEDEKEHAEEEED